MLVETPTDRPIKTVKCQDVKRNICIWAESQRKNRGIEVPRFSVNKVVGPGYGLLTWFADGKGSKFFGVRSERNDLKVTMGSKEIIFHFLTLRYLRGMQQVSFRSSQIKIRA